MYRQINERTRFGSIKTSECIGSLYAAIVPIYRTGSLRPAVELQLQTGRRYKGIETKAFLKIAA